MRIANYYFDMLTNKKNAANNDIQVLFKRVLFILEYHVTACADPRIGNSTYEQELFKIELAKAQTFIQHHLDKTSKLYEYLNDLIMCHIEAWRKIRLKRESLRNEIPVTTFELTLPQGKIP